MCATLTIVSVVLVILEVAILFCHRSTTFSLKIKELNGDGNPLWGNTFPLFSFHRADSLLNFLCLVFILLFSR